MAEFPSWQQGFRPSYEPLRGSVKADAAVVGGGLAGVITALMLQENGLQVILLERDMLGHGSTFGCSGLLTWQAPVCYQRAASAYGVSTARTYAQLLREAAIGLQHAARTIRIARLTERSVYLYAETEDDLPALEKLLALESKLGLQVSIARDAGGCPFPVELSAVMQHQSTLQPLPFLLALAERAVRAGCRIYERTPVTALHRTHLRTPEGAASADMVILCTGVPLDCRSSSVLSLLEPRLRETRVLRTPVPLHTVQRSVQADEPDLIPLQDGLLLTFDRGAYGTRQADVSRIIRDRTLHALLPDAATRDVILRRELYTRDGMPLIGPVTPGDSHVLMAGGFNAHGLAGAFLAAKTLCAYAMGHPEAESALFRPFRFQPGRTVFRGTALQNAVKRRLRRWSHLTTPRCPHMGCPLRYHPGTRQWECPCHGSAFDVFGQVISAPALHSATLSPKDRPPE